MYFFLYTRWVLYHLSMSVNEVIVGGKGSRYNADGGGSNIILNVVNMLILLNYICTI